jgi:hypothetical protein
MAMVKRIKTSDWATVLSSLSERNRFRPITVEGGALTKVDSTMRLYFIGIKIRRENDDVQLDVYVCSPSDARAGFLCSSVLSLKSLSVDETAQDGVRLLTATSGTRGKLQVRFTGSQDAEVRRDAIAKLAYFLYERRGGLGGSALEDWGDAERLFSDWECLIEQKFI